MKAKHKKLKILNERYLELLDELIMQGNTATDSSTTEANKQFCDGLKELEKAENHLRQALKEALRELGSVYYEISEVTRATSGQSVKEFRDFLHRETKGTMQIQSPASNALIAIRVARIKADLMESQEEIDHQEAFINTNEQYRNKAIPAVTMASRVIKESTRASKRLKRLQK